MDNGRKRSQERHAGVKTGESPSKLSQAGRRLIGQEMKERRQQCTELLQW